MLSGYRVLDCSDSRGDVCAKFLASLGAEVIKVENPNTQLDSTWYVRNLGKQCISLNLDAPEGVELFLDLIKQCDFLIETFAPSYLAERGLDFSTLEKIHSKLIMVSITPFGQTGPYKDFKGGELVGSAMGGTLSTCGYPDDTPVLEALDACCFHASAAASLGAMLAHRERGVSGKGQHVDCSIQEVAASRNTSNLLSYQFDNRKLERAGNRVRFGVATVRVVWELADGYCFHSLMTGQFGAPANSALSKWMTDDGFENPMVDVDWARYDRSQLPAEERLRWEAAIDTFFKTKTKLQIRTEGYERGIRATVANAPNDVLNDDHLKARDFFHGVKNPQGENIQQSNYFLRLSQSQYRIPEVIPELGAQNKNVYGDLLGLNDDSLKQLHEKGVV